MSAPGYNLGGPVRRSVLVVDDEPGIRTALTAHFAREGWQVVAASGVHEAEYRLAQGEFDLLVSDVRLPDGSGAELLRAAQATPVVLMSAFATVPDAVAAMRGGARDYLTKPVAWTELRAVAERFAGVESAPAAADGFAGGMIGREPAFTEALRRARAAARTDAHVVIEGESGTGKKLLARYIHEASNRAAAPFPVVNCASPSLESELFGKLDAARGGALLLERVEAMPLGLQSKLLEALKEPARLGPGARLLSTTGVSLAAAADRGRFRSDLHYRLNAVSLLAPPLRERKGDIPLLAAHFAQAWGARERRPAPAFTAEALQALREGAWPGNIRELEACLGRVFARLATGHTAIDEECIGEAVSGLHGMPAAETDAPAPVPIRELERLHLQRALELTRGNRTHAAEMLGISLRTVRNKIREYGLPPRRYA